MPHMYASENYTFTLYEQHSCMVVKISPSGRTSAAPRTSPRTAHRRPDQKAAPHQNANAPQYAIPDWRSKQIVAIAANVDASAGIGEAELSRAIRVQHQEVRW